jgi:putative hydrolase of the HAD superfamily
MERSFRAVIFDLGGVVFDSPLHAIARFELDFGIPAGHVNRVVVATGATGAWSRLERGELAVAAFAPLFERECADAGHPIDALAMMARIGEAAAPRPTMLAALRALRARGFALAALTNNWQAESGRSGDRDELRALFDAFVESAVVGVRKPDPRIYELACEALGVTPAQAVFLDDIGLNLKAARALGMATIKVDAPDAALAELERVLGLEAGALASKELPPVVAAGND